MDLLCRVCDLLQSEKHYKILQMTPTQAQQCANKQILSAAIIEARTRHCWLKPGSLSQRNVGHGRQTVGLQRLVKGAEGNGDPCSDDGLAALVSCCCRTGSQQVTTDTTQTARRRIKNQSRGCRRGCGPVWRPKQPRSSICLVSAPRPAVPAGLTSARTPGFPPVTDCNSNSPFPTAVDLSLLFTLSAAGSSKKLYFRLLFS